MDLHFPVEYIPDYYLKSVKYIGYVMYHCCPGKFGGSSIASAYLSTDGVIFCFDTKSNQKDQGSRKAG
ncbi:MAG: hypothetical protein J0I41_21230 [Filimonas sp.]|nr:hypothetical protein [Filimonas sp.]